MPGKTGNQKNRRTSYKVLVFNERQFKKDIKGLARSVRKRILAKLDGLVFPFPINLDIRHLEKGYYRIRVSRYRIIVGVDQNKKTIWVYRILKRDDNTYTFVTEYTA